MRINHQAVRSQQYAMTHNWNFVLNKLPAGLSGFEGLTGANGVLNLHCETSGIPNDALNMATGKIRGITVTQPGDTAPGGGFSAQFIERDDYIINKFFDTWKQLASHRTTALQAPKRNVMVFNDCEMHLLNGEGAIVGKYRPLNICPVRVSEPSLAPSSDMQRTSVDFSYTTFERIDEKGAVVGGSDRI